jgi:hypothetical protein
VRYVSYSARFDWPEADWRALVAAAPTSWKLHHEQLERETHETMPMLGAYLGLREVFADASRIAAMPAGTPPPTTSILPYFDRLSGPMAPHRASGGAPEGRRATREGRGAEARGAYQKLACSTASCGRRCSARIAEVAQRPPLPKPSRACSRRRFTVDEMLGFSARGGARTDRARESHALTLILRVEAGCVAATPGAVRPRASS